VSRRFPRPDPGYFVAALLPLVGILPTLANGVINTADGPLHVQRIFAMSVMLGEGNLWPRWIPWFHIGFGYPIFNFYPPGVFYLGGLLVRLGFSATAAFTVVATFAWVLGSVGVYHLARRWLPPMACLLAVMLWAYAPSRLFEVWDQGSLPQMLAAAFVPWLFAGIADVAARPSLRGTLRIVLPLAGLVLSHQPITFITALFVAPLSLVAPLWASRKAWNTLLPRLTGVFGGLALGAALTAIFMLPLVMELRYVQAARGAEDNVDYLISNFLTPAEVFAQPLPMDLTDLRFELPTTLGLVGGILAVPGLIALFRRRQYALLALLLLGLGFTLFMLLEVSLPVWLGIPFFRQLRFPERFLRVGSVMIALAGGASILLLPRRWRTAALALGMVAVLVAALPLVYPNQRFLVWDDLTAEDEIEFELTNYTWGTTSYDEFDPIWGERIPLPLSAPEQKEYATNPLRVVVYRVDMARYGEIMQVEQVDTAAVRVRLAQPHSVRFHQYYFPGWTATLNGEPVEIYADDEFGLITVDLPEGEHIVELAYTGTPAQTAGSVITLASLCIVAGVLAFARRAPSPPIPSERLEPRMAGLVAAGVIGFALINSLILTPNTLLFRHRSPPDDPVYMETRVDAPFGDEFVLLGYTLDQHEVAPGNVFSITLYWRPQREIDDFYRPVVQLVNLNLTEAWGASEPFFPGGGHSVGYPPDRFASEVHELRVFDDAPPYVARVSVQMLHVDSGEPLRLPDGADRVLLEPLIRITGEGTPVENRLNATFGESISLHCASAGAIDGGYAVDLFWHVESAPPADLKVFVHALAEDGEMVAQADGPPLNGDYPTHLWTPGQTLHERRIVQTDETVAQFAVGLYTPDGARLTATQNSAALPDNRLLLPLDGKPCRP